MEANLSTSNGAPRADTTMADNSPPRPYVPQFTAQTTMILQRIKSGVGGLGVGLLGQGGAPPPGYEDMKRSVLQGMKTSMNMELPAPLSAQARRLAKNSPTPGRAGATPAPYVTPYGKLSGGGTSSGNGNTGRGKRARATKAGSKRKRAKSETESAEDSDILEDDESESDGSGSIAMPRMTQSGRQIVKPVTFVPSPASSSRKRGPSKRSQEEKNEQALCKRCGRGHSPQRNMIVFCDGCNLPWHQMCHEPIISEEAVKDENADWYCAECCRKKGIIPPFDATRGVSWQGKSTEQKRTYLETLTKPQLVSLLVHAATLYPHLPVFPASPQPPSRAATQERRTNPSQPFPPSAATASGLFSRADSNPNGTINFIRKITPAGNTPSPSFPPNDNNISQASAPSMQSQPVQAEDVDADADAEGSRESTPASPPYPKPGMGLMAKLGPDDQDEEWLVDHNDFEAFSHVVFEDTEVGGGS